jgi:DNA invertase Pin-like site-specific DNA recombinase
VNATAAPRRLRIVANARVSTDKQELSLDAQRAKFEAYARAYDVDLVEVTSDALSGKNTDRPGLQRALAMLRDGEADGLLVAKLDRLTRDVGDFAALQREYFDSGRWALLSVEDKVDTTTAMGRFVLTLHIALAQLERERLVERTRDALAHLRAKGGGTPRLEGEAVARIFELDADGRSMREIARVLTEEGIPTLKGGKWGPSTVAKVLGRARSGVM